MVPDPNGIHPMMQRIEAKLMWPGRRSGLRRGVIEP